METTNVVETRKVKFIDLGLIDYKEAWDLQTTLAKSTIANKRAEYTDMQLPYHHLLFCQHKNVYTLGKSGSIDHLLLSEDALKEADIDYYPINRGGDITYHGPGQLVVYPILDLDLLERDVHLYVRNLEQVIINVLNNHGLKGERIEGFTGVWFDDVIKRKICAIGVHLSRWVSMHGLAFNVSPDLQYFNNIIPCGIQEDTKTVTSLEKELDQKVDMDVIKSEVKKAFENVFKIELI